MSFSVTMWCSFYLLWVPNCGGGARIKGKGEASMKVTDEGAQQYGAAQRLGMALWRGSTENRHCGCKNGQNFLPLPKSTIWLCTEVTAWRQNFCPHKSVANMG